jgi:outer membrane protein OmpA-like peptidoglycan-associated protein
MNVMGNTMGRSALAGVSAVAIIAMAGCSRVKPEELSAELARLRSEMRTEIQQGDQQVTTQLGGRIDGLDSRLDAIATDLEQRSDEFDVTVTRLESAIRFNAPVYFGFDDATVRPADQEVLDRFADVVKSYYPDAAITAEGFTDASGSAEYNKTLGKKRADAVVSYLQTAGGLSQAQLRAVSYGEETQRMMDESRGPGEAGLRNRRVVLVIEGQLTPEEKSPAPAATN